MGCSVAAAMLRLHGLQQFFSCTGGFLGSAHINAHGYAVDMNCVVTCHSPAPETASLAKSALCTQLLCLRPAHTRISTHASARTHTTLDATAQTLRPGIYQPNQTEQFDPT